MLFLTKRSTNQTFLPGGNTNPCPETAPQCIRVDNVRVGVNQELSRALIAAGLTGSQFRGGIPGFNGVGIVGSVFLVTAFGGFPRRQPGAGRQRVTGCPATLPRQATVTRASWARSAKQSSVLLEASWARTTGSRLDRHSSPTLPKPCGVRGNHRRVRRGQDPEPERDSRAGQLGRSRNRNNSRRRRQGVWNGRRWSPRRWWSRRRPRRQPYLRRNRRHRSLRSGKRRHHSLGRQI
jgi:hypothetical protein